MIVAPPCLVACPHCAEPLMAFDICSSNTFGARFYSDGYADGPMMSNDSGICQCDHCGQPFYRTLAKTLLEDMEDAKTHPEYKNNPVYLNPPMARDTMNPKVLLPMLEKATDPDERRQLHMLCMWGHNHTDTKLEDQAHRDNLLALLTYLRIDVSHDLCMSADIHRQMGDFEEAGARAQHLLDNPRADSYHSAARQIQAAARAAHSKVIEIKKGG
jgi:hypothetical protein